MKANAKDDTVGLENKIISIRAVNWTCDLKVGKFGQFIVLI